MTPASTGAALKALELIETEPQRRQHLLTIAEQFRTGLKQHGFTVIEGVTPVIPILVGDMGKTFMVCKILFENGIYVNPVVVPAVPADATLIRTSLTATHTAEQIDRALAILAKVGREMEIIPA